MNRLRDFFGFAQDARSRRVPAQRPRSNGAGAKVRRAPEGQRPRAEPAEPPQAPPPLPAAAFSKVGNLDHAAVITVVLAGEEEDFLHRIGQRIERGRFKVPQLPSTSLAAIEMANQPGADVAELVQLISHDPLLCSELLKTANSVLYAAHVPAETLHDAVMRIGLRAMRSLIFSVSMRGAILKGHLLGEYAEEVWRQALSVAGIARAIGPSLQVEPEHAFMLGLLQDIGKVALLTILRDEVTDSSKITTALVGRVFHAHHEKAGAAMAKAWRLSDEFASVAGNHHDYAINEEHPSSAALAFLAHQLDLHLSLRDEEGFRALVASDVMEFLQVPQEARWQILERARTAYEGAAAGEIAEAPTAATLH